jgi:acetyl esterase/lipase
MKRPRPSWFVTVLIAALTAGAVALPADAAPHTRTPTHTQSEAEPELAVGPAEDLADGQQVTVTGSGFAPDRALTVHQCQAPDFLGLVDCDFGTAHPVTTGADGSFSTRLPVYAVIDTWGTAVSPFLPGTGEGVDCREPGACMLATEPSFQDLGAAVTAPLSFDPDTDEHLPSMTVTEDDGLVDRQEVRVEGQGFVRSERPLVRIYQCGTAPEWGEMCRRVPTQTAEVDERGRLAASLPVSTTLPVFGTAVDCRRPASDCYLEAVAAGRSRSPRTAVQAPLGFDPDADIPDWPPPQVSVTPTTDTGRLQELAVRGTDFTPGGTVGILQCPSEGPGNCLYVLDSFADARGDVDIEVTVPATLDVTPPETVDCHEAPGCVLVVQDLDRGIDLRTPLTFRQPGPGRRYLDPVFDEVDADRDVLYRETTDSSGNPVQLRLDIYRPRGDTATKRPATVWMHGGFFRGGDKSSMSDWATESARYGQVGVSISYRVRPDADTWREMYLASLDAYDDATAAVEWLRRHADEYGIDPDAIFAGGFSAGAVTALNLAYLPGQRGPATSLVAAAIPNSGLLYTAPERGEPPTIAFHGTTDGILPYDNLATLCPQAALVDVPCELVTYQGGGHGVGSPEEHHWRSGAFVAEHVLEPRGYFDVTAEAGGPYEVAEGSTVGLDATGSTGDGLGYAWSPAERVDDAGSPTPNVLGRDDGTETLALRATNRHGVADHAETELITTNVDPSIGTTSLRATGTRRVAFQSSVTDPGRLDAHTATVDWGDGTVEPATVEQGAGDALVSGRHTYVRPGRYTVTLTVADDDGATDDWTGSIVVRRDGAADTPTPPTRRHR